MGLPGVGLIYLFDFIIRVLTHRPISESNQYGDLAWPIALTYSMLLPWIILAVYLLLEYFGPRVYNSWFLLWSFCLVLFLSLVFHFFFIYPEGYRRAQAQIQDEVSPEAKRSVLLQPILSLVNAEGEYYFMNLQNQKNNMDISTAFVRAWRDAEAHPEIYKLTKAQTESLKKFAAELQEMQEHPELITEDKIKNSPEWKSLRDSANQALKAFE